MVITHDILYVIPAYMMYVCTICRAQKVVSDMLVQLEKKNARIDKLESIVLGLQEACVGESDPFLASVNVYVAISWSCTLNI
jgi:hypothetical protein